MQHWLQHRELPSLLTAFTAMAARELGAQHLCDAEWEPSESIPHAAGSPHHSLMGQQGTWHPDTGFSGRKPVVTPKGLNWPLQLWMESQGAAAATQGGQGLEAPTSLSPSSRCRVQQRTRLCFQRGVTTVGTARPRTGPCATEHPLPARRWNPSCCSGVCRDLPFMAQLWIYHVTQGKHLLGLPKKMVSPNSHLCLNKSPEEDKAPSPAASCSGDARAAGGQRAAKS